MKIKSIKAVNFRSIVDTSFDTPENLTALVGGNESGKSNILKALIAFFSDRPFSPADRHQLCINEPEIFIEFELTSEEKQKIASLIENDKFQTLTIQKRGAEKNIVNLEIPENIPPITEPVTEIASPSEEISDPAETTETDSPKEEDLTPQTPPKPTKNEIISEILKMLPVLVSVQSVEDLISGVDIKIEDLKAAQKKEGGKLSTINAFLHLGGVDLDKLSSPSIPLSDKNKMLLAGAARAGKKIREYWIQEDLKINIATDGKYLSIHVRDGGCLPTRPILKEGMNRESIDKANKNIEEREDDTKWIWTNLEERSSGFRWFVTFYAKYLEKVSEAENIIMIIDDLGIYLNASIQQVLYKKLLSFDKEKIQIIYTTHSSYMLDFADTKNVLLVEKKENGTKVLEDWWSKKSFRELPQPLREVGVTRADHIFKPKNLLVEGATDISVIRRLVKMFEVDDLTTNTLETINMYPVGGKDEAIGVGLYCKADGKKAAILYDSESDALKLNQKAKSHGLKSEDIETLAGTYEKSAFKVESIEDLIPDKIIVDALNTIAQELFSTRWVPISKLHRKHDKSTLGIMSAIKIRLEKIVKDGDLTGEEMETILGSKKAILTEALENVKQEDYIDNRKQAIINVLTNLSGLINSL